MVTAPPLRAVVPPESVVKLVSAVVVPTEPPKVVVPVVLTARARAPLTVLLNVMS